MTKTVHFHVGSGRCGSTLLQALFNHQQMLDIFSNSGVLYENVTYLETAPKLPTESLVEEDWQEIRETRFRRPLVGVDNLFVTQENIFGVLHEPGKGNICEASCDVIEYLTEGFLTRILILIRRQDTFLESLYNQLIKRAETRDFDTYLAEFPMENIAWDKVVDIYANRFGSENVTVLPFEKQVVESGGHPNFVDAVLSAIGVTVHVEPSNLPIANPSLAPRVIEIQRRANELFTEKESHAFANWLAENVNKRPDDPHGLMSDEQRSQVLDRFRESNSRLFHLYMPDFDPNYYLAGA